MDGWLMAHLSPLQLVQVMEAGHVIATQRDQAITERDHAQEQAEEWQRTANLAAAEAVKLQRQVVEQDTLIRRLRGDSLPSDGEVVRTEETVKVGNKL